MLMVAEGDGPQPVFSEAFERAVLAALRERGVSLRCPACGQREALALVDGYFSPEVLRPDADRWHFASHGNYPMIAVHCLSCGFVRFHGLEYLGVDPEGVDWTWDSIRRDNEATGPAKGAAEGPF